MAEVNQWIELNAPVDPSAFTRAQRIELMTIIAKLALDYELMDNTFFLDP